MLNMKMIFSEDKDLLDSWVIGNGVIVLIYFM